MSTAHRSARANVWGVLLIPLALGAAHVCLPGEVRATDPGPFNVSVHDTLTGPVVAAYLYNPPAHGEEDAQGPTGPLRPSLVLTGAGFEDGGASVAYRIEGEEGTLREGETEIQIAHGRFESEIVLDERLPDARAVAWQVKAAGAVVASGNAPLRWSRFSGRVLYHDEPDDETRTTYIYLMPVTWGAPGQLIVPVAQDGAFDALVPARVYGVLMAGDKGIGGTSLERWGWDYDLTRDREDVFTIGRTELYGIHAFEIRGGPPSILVGFRPSSLSRALRFDDDGDGFVRGNEESMLAALKESPTALAPELTAEDVKVWLNGREQEIRRFDMIPEYDGDAWQAYYLLQIYTGRRIERGVWHEVKLEVRSTELLGDEERLDFGQGSAGFFRP